MPNNRKLLDALPGLHNGGQSGILRVQRESIKKQLVLHSGKLAFAESNLTEEHLARILVMKGFLPRTAISEIAALMKAGKTSEEAILATSNSDTLILEQGRREQAVAILASLLTWDDCDVRFYPGDNLIRYMVDLGLGLPEVLVLSARIAVSSRAAAIPPGFLSRSLTAAPGNPLEQLNLPLNSAESHAVALAGKGLRIAELLPMIPAGETKPEEVLLRLVILGLVRIEEPMAAPPETASASDEDSSPKAAGIEDMLLRHKSADLYEILGVSTNASREDIQSAYHRMARQFHPDRFQSAEFSAEMREKAERIFARINESYGTLGDSALRAAYDEKRLKETIPAGAGLKAGAAAASEEERTAAALFREGRLCLARGDFEKAAEHFRGSVWLCPDRAEYHRYLGMAQSEISKYRKSAEEHFLKSIELDTFSIESRLELAKLYLKVGLPRKAGKQVREVLLWDPKNPEARRLSAMLKQPEKT